MENRFDDFSEVLLISFHVNWIKLHNEIKVCAIPKEIVKPFILSLNNWTEWISTGNPCHKHFDTQSLSCRLNRPRLSCLWVLSTCSSFSLGSWAKIVQSALPLPILYLQLFVSFYFFTHCLFSALRHRHKISYAAAADTVRARQFGEILMT